MAWNAERHELSTVLRAARGRRRSLTRSARPAIDADGGRWNAHRCALLTMLALFAATFVIFIADNLILAWTPRTTLAIADDGDGGGMARLRIR